jgi:hypothetical protein
MNSCTKGIAVLDAHEVNVDVASSRRLPTNMPKERDRLQHTASELRVQQINSSSCALCCETEV